MPKVGIWMYLYNSDMRQMGTDVMELFFYQQKIWLKGKDFSRGGRNDTKWGQRKQQKELLE